METCPMTHTSTNNMEVYLNRLSKDIEEIENKLNKKEIQQSNTGDCVPNFQRAENIIQIPITNPPSITDYYNYDVKENGLLSKPSDNIDLDQTSEDLENIKELEQITQLEKNSEFPPITRCKKPSITKKPIRTGEISQIFPEPCQINQLNPCQTDIIDTDMCYNPTNSQFVTTFLIQQKMLKCCDLDVCQFIRINVNKLNNIKYGGSVNSILLDFCSNNLNLGTFNTNYEIKEISLSLDGFVPSEGMRRAYQELVSVQSSSYRVRIWPPPHCSSSEQPLYIIVTIKHTSDRNAIWNINLVTFVDEYTPEMETDTQQDICHSPSYMPHLRHVSQSVTDSIISVPTHSTQ